MMYEIKKGIPMPESPRAKYDFDIMEVGDMFFVPVGDEDPEVVRKRVSSSASMAGKRLGWTFSTQFIKENEEMGVGVWRTL